MYIHILSYMHSKFNLKRMKLHAYIPMPSHLGFTRKARLEERVTMRITVAFCLMCSVVRFVLMCISFLETHKV